MSRQLMVVEGWGECPASGGLFFLNIFLLRIDSLWWNLFSEMAPRVVELFALSMQIDT